MTNDELSKQRKIESRKKIDPLRNAQEICQRYNARGGVFPCRWVDRQNDPLKEQEFKDALKLTRWKLALKGNRSGYGVCSNEVRDYLDRFMPGWRDDVMKRSASLKHAQDIARRYVIRGHVLPRPLLDKSVTDPILIQEHKDFTKLLVWQKSLNGTGRKCPVYIFQYLDKEIRNWGDVAEFRRRGSGGPRKKTAKNPAPSVSSEESDLDSINCDIKVDERCEVLTTPDDMIADISKKRDVSEFVAPDKDVSQKRAKLSPKSEGQRRSHIEPLVYAHDIVERYHQRGQIFPCRWVDRQNDPVKEQEFKDALKLTRWKLALKGNRSGYGVCSDEVRDFLDREMPGWRADRNA
jgi:hypothetical protein